MDFTVANNKGWFPSPCSSWDIWGFRNRLTGHPLCRTLLLVIAEGEESTAKHKLAFKASAWKHITFAQSNFHDQARKWHSLGEGSKYLWKLTQFIIVFLSHHKYLVQSPFSSQNTLSSLPVPSCLSLGRPYDKSYPIMVIDSKARILCWVFTSDIHLSPLASDTHELKRQIICFLYTLFWDLMGELSQEPLPYGLGALFCSLEVDFLPVVFRGS